MSSIEAGAVIVRIMADSSALTAGLTKASGQMGAWKRQVAAIGAGMTKFVTLPVLAAAAASGKFALDFEKSMTDIEALVGMSAHEVEGFKKQILALAPAVGKGPKELADAFYFIASSGLKGKAAMDALKASAIASAAGLGATKTVADAVTSAINAYGQKTLSAAQATDILTAAVREGKSEPEEFAASIGRVIPLAAKMGVSFGEVSGIMAAMSLNGTNAHEAVTQITAMLAQAIRPSKDGAAALKSIGMSYADLRKEIRDRGLTETIEHMDRAFKGNIETLGRLFPNIRALRGFLALTGPEAEKYAAIIERVSKAQGDAATAAEIALAKPGARIQKAWAGIQANLITAGDVMLPIFAKIADSVASAAKAFDSLSDSTKEWVVKGALIAAVAGPALIIIGKTMQAVLALRAAYLALAGAQAVSAAGAVGVGVGGAAAAGAMAGLVALVPAAAISAALATAIVYGAQKGFEQGKIAAAQGASQWESVWQGITAGIKAPGEALSAWALGNTEILKQAFRNLDAETAAATGMAAQRMRYLRQDLEAVWSKPAILAPLDASQSMASLRSVRNNIVSELGISVKEANRVMATMFPDKWPGAERATGSARRSLAQLGAEADRLRAKLAREMAFGALKGADKTRAELRKVESALETARSKARKAAQEIGEVGTIVATGMTRSGQKVKISADQLVKFIQLPMGKAAPWFAKAGGDASAKFGGGIGKGQAKAAANAQKLANAAKKPAQAAVGAMTASGNSAAMGFAAGIGNQAAVAQARANAAALAQAAIDAVKSTGGESSPWKTTMKAGINMVLGLALGMKKAKPKAVAAAAELAQNILSVLNATLDIGDAIGTLESEGLPATKLAKKWAARVAKLLRAMTNAMRGELAKLKLGAKNKNVERLGFAAEMASNIASIFEGFTDLTAESIDKALTGIALAKDRAKEVAAAVAAMVKDFRLALKKTVITENQASTTDRAFGLAGSVASLFGAFVDLTTESVDKALVGIAYARTRAGELAAEVAAMVADFRNVLALAISEQEGTAGERATGVAGHISSILGMFAEMTKASIDTAIKGIAYAAERAPDIGTAVRAMIQAMQAALSGITIEEPFEKLSGSVANVVSNVSGIISSLGSNTIEAVENGIGGAWTVSNRAKKLGEALAVMVRNIVAALGVVSVDSLADTQKLLEALAQITSAISTIVNSLAEATAEKVAAATAAGGSLGEGFYSGLLSWHARIVAEAQSIAADAAAALGSPGGGGALVAAPAGGGGTVTQTYTDNSRLSISLPPGLTASEARSITRSEISAWEARKKAAADAFKRGRVR